MCLFLPALGGWLMEVHRHSFSPPCASVSCVLGAVFCSFFPPFLLTDWFFFFFHRASFNSRQSAVWWLYPSLHGNYLKGKFKLSPSITAHPGYIWYLHLNLDLLPLYNEWFNTRISGTLPCWDENLSTEMSESEKCKNKTKQRKVRKKDNNLVGSMGPSD